MKTTKVKFKLAGLFALLLTFLAFSPAKVQAQCPAIRNMLNCKVDVTATVYTFDGNFCTKVCNTVTLTIPAGATLPVNCACSPVCNVVVNVIAIQSVPVSGTANFSTPPPGNTIAGPAGPCMPGGAGNPKIFYSAGLFRITP